MTISRLVWKLMVPITIAAFIVSACAPKDYGAVVSTRKDVLSSVNSVTSVIEEKCGTGGLYQYNKAMRNGTYQGTFTEYAQGIDFIANDGTFSYSCP